MHKHIHTVTLIPYHKKPKHKSHKNIEWDGKSTFGFYWTRLEARKGLQAYCDSESGYYTHAVIERYAPGIYKWSKNAEWYAYNRKTTHWDRIPVPEWAEHICNWGM